ncbi:MAG TPA: carboxypeptidase-like regulatory domain-containing protein [Mucilaginibacter sp.]|nr:carboxypeptidase-like regulatory domain-containing protein [Mucilaginibacter sp.]
MLLKYLTIIILFLLPSACLAQLTLTGRIINIVDKKPVAGASVFLNNATIGNSSNNDGSFILTNIRNGHYELVVSIVGYEPYRQTMLINNDINLGNIEVIPRSIGLKEVKIRPNFNREKYYQIFKQKFLGTSDNAKQCKILNSDVLDIDYDSKTKKLTVNSDEFLEIENKALGYKLKYLLTSFVSDGKDMILTYQGSGVFENLPGSTSQQRKWQKNRVKTFEGSMMHFLRSLITGQMDTTIFKVYPLIRKSIDNPVSDSIVQSKIKFFRVQTGNSASWNDSLAYWTRISQRPKVVQKLIDSPLLIPDILRLTDKKGIYALYNPNCLYIIYPTKRVHEDYVVYRPEGIVKDYPVTIITFLSPNIFFDGNGGMLNAESAFTEGYWGNKRIGDTLPIDYQPEVAK